MNGNMNADDAIQLYYSTYRAGQWAEVDKPLIQIELKRRCMQAVIDAVRQECDRETAERLIALHPGNE